MKVFHLLPLPDLAATVKSTDFVYNQKYVKPGSMVIPFEKRFPIERNPPTENAQLTHDATEHRSYKFLAEMGLLDNDFMKLALHHALVDDIQKKETGRAALIADTQKLADQHAIEWEVTEQRNSIQKGWLNRFRMEKMFEHLGIKTMDDLKRMMRRIHHKMDLDNIHMHQMMLRQNRRDASSMLSPFEIKHMRHQEEELIRMKINLGHKEMSALEDMRRRLAEQFAAMTMAEIQQAHEMFKPQKKVS